MTIQHWSEYLWLVQLGDDPAFADDLDTLHADLTDAGQMPHIVLDLSDVQHVNSSNLSQILRVRKLAIDGETRLKLCCPTDAVWAILLATGLDKVFDFSGDTATALAELQLPQ